MIDSQVDSYGGGGGQPKMGRVHRRTSFLNQAFLTLERPS